MTKPNFKQEFRQIEADVIRQPRLLNKIQWFALGTDAQGPWLETFYSTANEQEVTRCLLVLTTNRLRCHVDIVERV